MDTEYHTLTEVIACIGLLMILVSVYFLAFV